MNETANLTTTGDYAIMESTTGTPTTTGATTVEDLTKRTLSSIVEQKLVLEYQIRLVQDGDPFSGDDYLMVEDYRSKIGDLHAELVRRGVTV